MSSTCSGLSALIEAATSQLGLLAETADQESEGSHLTSMDGENGSAASSEIATSPPFGPSSKPPMIVPDHERKNGKLSFPEQLMTLLMDPKNEDVVTFLPDGKYFAIRMKEFSDILLYKHFHLTTFEEFLELIRGWGFARVNSNNKSNNEDVSGDESIHSDSNCSRDSIHVFRHPHFKRNHPVNMHKLRFGSKKHAHQAVDTARVIGAVPSIAVDARNASPHRQQSQPKSDDQATNSSKRRLSPSHTRRNTADLVMKEQRPRHNSQNDTLMEDTSQVILAAVSVSQDTSDCHPQPRRSSIELRGAAEAIASSKLKLRSCEMAEDCNGTTTRAPGRRQERRISTASLVEGGVVAATHTIVTDAIETLLFDEKHTRETFKRHETELSTSSLPGVIPISKQLFDGATRTAAAAASIANTAISITAMTALTSSPKQPTKSTFTISNEPNEIHLEDLGRASSMMTYDILEEPTTDDDAAIHAVFPRKVTTDSNDTATASPARLEAAAALVSQSRQARVRTATTVRFAQSGGS
jgi:hypothetical protein